MKVRLSVSQKFLRDRVRLFFKSGVIFDSVAGFEARVLFLIKPVRVSLYSLLRILRVRWIIIHFTYQFF